MTSCTADATSAAIPRHTARSIRCQAAVHSPRAAARSSAADRTVVRGAATSTTRRHRVSGKGCVSQAHSIAPQRKSSPAGVSPPPNPARPAAPACRASASPCHPARRAVTAPAAAVRAARRTVAAPASPPAPKISSRLPGGAQPLHARAALATRGARVPPVARSASQSGRGSHTTASCHETRCAPISISPARNAARVPGWNPAKPPVRMPITMFSGPFPMRSCTTAMTSPSGVATSQTSSNAARTLPWNGRDFKRSRTVRLMQTANRCWVIWIDSSVMASRVKRCRSKRGADALGAVAMPMSWTQRLACAPGGIGGSYSS